MSAGGRKSSGKKDINNHSHQEFNSKKLRKDACSKKGVELAIFLVRIGTVDDGQGARHIKKVVEGYREVAAGESMGSLKRVLTK